MTTMTTLSIADHNSGNYTIHTAGKVDYRGSIRRNTTNGGYTVRLDGEEWQMRHMPRVTIWDEMGDAIVATKPQGN